MPGKGGAPGPLCSLEVTWAGVGLGRCYGGSSRAFGVQAALSSKNLHSERACDQAPSLGPLRLIVFVSLFIFLILNRSLF